MNESNVYFEQAIDIIVSLDSLGTSRIIGEMAKRYPKEFCECAGVKPWQLRAREIAVTEGKFVEAIKYVREQTGWDLKTAKEAVERLTM